MCLLFCQIINVLIHSFVSRVQASLAGAAIWLGSLPEKMSPVVRPIMDILKKESNQQLQVTMVTLFSGN